MRCAGNPPRESRYTIAPPPSTDPAASFRWPDGERVVFFGRGALAEARGLLGSGYTLLCTDRAARCAPELVAAAEAVHHVAPGRVDELAAGLRPHASGSELLVALGGGRIIDTAKALAAADPPRRVAAIPTTLSGAEMTSVHRHASGITPDTARVRPSIVVNDPSLSASQPVTELAASAANALGHAAEGPLTPLASPVAALAALEAARLLALALAGDMAANPDRDSLALGALLAGYVIGSTGYGLHHVVSQTLVRFAGIDHGAANALMLPHTLVALASRAPLKLAQLGIALGDEPPEFAAHLRELAGLRRLRDAGVSRAELDRCAREASSRAELQLTPPAASEDELRELYAVAW